MSIIFHQLLETTEGRIPLDIGSGPIVGGIPSQGLIINSSGEIHAVLDGVIDYYYASMPFDADDRLCVTSDICASEDQAIPFAANGSISINGTGPGDFISQGLSYKMGCGLISTTPINPMLPSQVQNLVVTTPVDNQINSSWDANPAPENVTSYTVEYRPQSSGPWIPTNVGLSTSLIILFLESGVTYQVRVYATNAAGDGPVSTFALGTVTGIPEAPTNLAATPGIIQGNFTWDAPTASPAITSYVIEYKEASSGTWIDFDGTGLSNNIDIFNLDPVLQDFRVAGVNSTGQGAFATIQMTPTAISSPREVEWNEKGVDDVNDPIQFVNNTGGFGATSDLTVFVNQANCTPNSHKGKPCWQNNGAAYIKTAVPPTDMGSQASFIWCGIPFFLNFNNRRIWGSSFESSSAIAQEFNTFIEQTGAFINAGAGMDATNTEWIVYGRFGSGANSYVRIIKNGGIDVSGSGFAGNGTIQPEMMGWQFPQAPGEDFPAQNFELTFYDGLLSTSEENALIDSIKQKWFLGVPG